jgi:putative transposase
MSRGAEGRDIFNDDLDRETFLMMLANAKKAFGFRIFAYCLMANHFHLLIQVGDPPLYLGMHHFLTRYSQRFNQRHDHRGHLFQSRYAAPLCRQDSYLKTLLRYIHMNPVRAGLVESPADWHWSGHNAFLGTTMNALLDLHDLAALRGESLSELRAHYNEAIAEKLVDDLAGEISSGNLTKNNPSIPPLPVLADLVARDYGLLTEDLCGGKRGRFISPAKLAFIERAQSYGYSLREIAEMLTCSPAAVTLLRRRKN